MLKRLPLATILTAVVMIAQQPNGAAINPPWPSADVIQTGDLVKRIQDKANAPAVFQVGFANLYKSKHVPGSVYAGPGSKDEGLADLKKAVADVPKDRQIVLYCGCCPWDRCPNMKPAYSLLHSLGYTRIKIVEIPNNFAKDWVEKGFPVEGASAASSPER
jgi:thiosulfate/3-mercaptopyruvate sulfurtransferase